MTDSRFLNKNGMYFKNIYFFLPDVRQNTFPVAHFCLSVPFLYSEERNPTHVFIKHVVAVQAKDEGGQPESSASTTQLSGKQVFTSSQ